ncbi:tetratricopeptide repeat protein [Chromobacterium violaceum]|uniref:tetratricopeptide repeat protein n=1 Tax=Chromobacterium violaceum TaxID=536 RepID=UPI00159437D4|nr:tetratricopeptide repeat protein [Chromobacterium violaceum]
MLDQEELFRLAVNAMENQRHPDAVALLKQGIANDGQDARLHYLLGAEYAQLGMPDRAAAAMEQAVALQPNLVMAVFQLGLLYLTQGRPDDAQRAWQGLDILPQDSALQLFRQGLEHLIRDEFAECRTWLEKGIDANQEIPVLNADMERILQQIAAHEAAAGAAGQVEQSSSSASNLFLRGYAASGDESFH